MRPALAVAFLSLAGCAAEPGVPPSAPAPAAAPAIVEAAPEPPPDAATLKALQAPARGDLDVMAARGVVRVLVPTRRASFEVKDGLQQGAAYSAGKAFEAFLNTTTRAGAPPLKVVFLPTSGDLVAALVEGRGDAAAHLIAVPAVDPPPVPLVAALTDVRELVAIAPGTPRLVSLQDFNGRPIHVVKGSRHHQSLLLLNQRLKEIDQAGCTIVTIDEAMDDEDLLARVDAGTLPAAIVDSHVAELWKGRLKGATINPDIAVGQDAVLAWATRPDSPQLLAALTAFAQAKGARALYGR